MREKSIFKNIGKWGEFGNLGNLKNSFRVEMKNSFRGDLFPGPGVLGSSKCPISQNRTPVYLYILTNEKMKVFLDFRVVLW